MMLRKQQESSPPRWWWLDAHNNNNDSPTRRSPWLQSALSELDEKTTDMLKLIESDADSFAQRAETYYLKRPDLISVVEEFYRMHRLLAERFDQMKTESATRILKTFGSPFSCNERFCVGKSTTPVKYRNYDTCSDTSDGHEYNPESDVDDPEEEDERTESTSPKYSSQRKLVGKVPIQGEGDSYCKMLKLRKEVEKLREENQMLRYEIARKDGERKEATEQLGVLMDEKKKLRMATLQREEQITCEDKGKGEAIQVSTTSSEIVGFDEDNPSSSKAEVGCFLRSLFPKSSNQRKAAGALSFGTFH